MALIDEIISKIESLPIEDGKLKLSISDFSSLPFMKSFFEKLLKEATLVLDNATRTPGEQTITVTGKANLLGYKSLSLTITFDVQDKEVVGTVRAVFDPGKITTLPVINWIRVADIGFVAAINETFGAVTFEFDVKILTLKDNRIPVSMRPISGENWNLTIGDDSYHAGAAEIIGLLGGHSLDKFLPKQLVDALDVVTLNGLDTTFNTNTKSISYFSIGVELAKRWEIIPNKVWLEEGLLISFTIVNADKKEELEFIANVRGTFMLGKTKVPIQIGTSVGGTTVWSFGIQMGEKVMLQNLAELLSLGNAESALPDGLANIPSINITTLNAEFNSTESKLQRLAFAIETADTWPVIKDYFEIEQLTIDFDITDVTDSAKRLVLGTLYGLFKIGDVYVFCSLAKTIENPNWTITAGLAPDTELNITAVAQNLFK